MIGSGFVENLNYNKLMCDMLPKNVLKVDKHYLYKGRPIKITNKEPIIQGFPAHYVWREVLPYSLLGKEERSYCRDIQLFQPLTKTQAQETAKLLHEKGRELWEP